MKNISLAFSTAVAMAAAQGVTEYIAPPGAPICSPDFPGNFELSMIDAGLPVQGLRKRQEGSEVLTLALSGGVLKDRHGRTGYIASNRQFQFDDPPQSGALYTGGFSVCGNNTLALATSRFYQCFTGEWYNLYDQPAASMCYAIYFDVLPYAPLQQVAANDVQVPAHLGAEKPKNQGPSTATVTATQTATVLNATRPTTLEVDTIKPTATATSAAIPQMKKASAHQQLHVDKRPIQGDAGRDGNSQSSAQSTGESPQLLVGDHAALGMFLAAGTVLFGVMFV